MEYLSLFKANYINDIDVKKLYDDRLNSMNTVHFSIKIHDNPSFLCINKELTVLLEEIQFLNSKIIQKNLIPKHIWLKHGRYIILLLRKLWLVMKLKVL